MKISRFCQLATLLALSLVAYLPVSAAGIAVTASHQDSLRVPTVVIATATASATRPPATVTNTHAPATNTPVPATNTPTPSRTPTLTASSTHTLAATTTATKVPTSTTTPTATPTTEATATATAQATAVLVQATSAYINPNTTNPWAQYYATRTAQAGSYVRLNPSTGTPTLAALSAYQNAATLTASPVVTRVGSATLSPTLATSPGTALALASGPRPQSNPVASSQSTQIAMAPDARNAPPAGAVQPDVPLDVTPDSVDQTVPMDRAYYARRLEVIAALGSALLALACGALATVALIRFVIAQLEH